jgi:three-Cys-motif partner protein
VSEAEANEKYWENFTNHQKVKHDLIRQYLSGWLPKLGSWSGRILYFDTHAGRGRHTSGELGSPIVALKTLVDHQFRRTHFPDCEINFFFIEQDKDNASFLEKEIAALRPLPPKIGTSVIVGDCFETLRSLIAHLREQGQSLAPAFRREESSS